MKYVVLAVLVFVASSNGQIGPYSTPSPYIRSFGPITPTPVIPAPQTFFSAGFNPYYNPVAPPIPIASYYKGHDIDGSYAFSLSTGNRKQVQESGNLKEEVDKTGEPQGVQVIKGTYTYVTPDGTPIEVTYIVDENGFKTTGVQISSDDKNKSEDTEVMQTSKDTEKTQASEDTEKAQNKKPIFHDINRNRYSNIYNRFDPYQRDKFDYYNPNRYDFNRYDGILYNPYDIPRYNYDPYNSVRYNNPSWFNSYLDS